MSSAASETSVSRSAGSRCSPAMRERMSFDSVTALSLEFRITWMERDGSPSVREMPLTLAGACCTVATSPSVTGGVAGRLAAAAPPAPPWPSAAPAPLAAPSLITSVLMSATVFTSPMTWTGTERSPLSDSPAGRSTWAPVSAWETW